jgi:hypothetical protein
MTVDHLFSAMYSMTDAVWQRPFARRYRNGRHRKYFQTGAYLWMGTGSMFNHLVALPLPGEWFESWYRTQFFCNFLPLTSQQAADIYTPQGSRILPRSVAVPLNESILEHSTQLEGSLTLTHSNFRRRSLYTQIHSLPHLILLPFTPSVVLCPRLDLKPPGATRIICEPLPSADVCRVSALQNCRDFTIQGGTFNVNATLEQPRSGENSATVVLLIVVNAQTDFRFVNLGDLNLLDEIDKRNVVERRPIYRRRTGAIIRHVDVPVGIRRMYRAQIFGAQDPMTAVLYNESQFEQVNLRLHLYQLS